jgi:hypothetical protein
MKKIVVSVQNGLLAEAITRMLYENGEFQPFRIPVSKASDVVKECVALSADILLMEVSYAEQETVETRVKEGIRIREKLPSCKIAFLCDENSSPDIAKEVTCAKKDGIIDTFFYSSVTGNYLTAILDAL